MMPSALQSYGDRNNSSTPFASPPWSATRTSSRRPLRRLTTRLPQLDGRSIRLRSPLISSNPFDVVGAEAAGMQASWVNRSGGIFDTLAPPPQSVVGSLRELAERLT